MKFKPVTKRYKFDSATLTRDYPDYLRTPIGTWLRDVMAREGIWYEYSGFGLNSVFLNNLNITLRESFPSDLRNFLNFVFEESDRTTDIIGIFLQNYAYRIEAENLEKMLALGGSAYAVTFSTVETISPYDRGVSNLAERVPTIIVENSQVAISSELLLQEAWQTCYSRNPDYEKTVSRCVDVLEGLLRDRYFPKISKPVLTYFIKEISKNPNTISYKGDSLINPKSLLTDLAKSFIEVRGQHTKGTGRNPIKNEAEFILHYTIFLWNLHQQ